VLIGSPMSRNARLFILAHVALVMIASLGA
jgi:hypothetical protein